MQCFTFRSVKMSAGGDAKSGAAAPNKAGGGGEAEDDSKKALSELMASKKDDLAKLTTELKLEINNIAKLKSVLKRIFQCFDLNSDGQGITTC